MHMRRSPLPILAALACSACAGNGEGLDQNGRPGGGSDELTATLQSIQDNVFTPICTACHVGASAPQGLRLDEGNSYNLLVGIASTEVPSLQRVQPGDPDNSYIIQKLEGHAAVGAQMPLGGPPLPEATIAVIRQWITDGAQATAGVSLGKPGGFAQELQPAADGVLLQVLANGIIVGFDTQLDASLVNATTITLQRRLSDDVFEDVPAQAVLNPVNSAVVLITPQTALTAGQYRLLLRGLSGGVALADMSGQPLGRDYVFEFGLETSR
jgi:hypothetical protein